MSGFRQMHPTSAWTVTRRSEDDSSPYGAVTETTVGSPTVGVEDVTAEVRRQSDGRQIALALRLWVEDVATVWRTGDRWRGTYRGQAVTLDAVSVTGPWGGPRDHVEVVAESPAGGP